MATPVTLALQATGGREVKAELKSVLATALDVEKQSLAAAEAASKKRIALIKEESKAKKAAIKEESAARKEAMTSERDVKKALGGKGSGGGDDGIASLLKNAGLAGVAFAAVSAAVNFATSSLKQFGSFVINDVVKPAFDLQTKAQQIANNSGGALTAQAIQDRAKAIGLKNNMDPMKVLEATSRFQDLTGEAKLGFDVLPLLATISKGRPDMDPKVLSEMAAAVYRPGMGSKDLNQVMLTLTGQGEKGSVPIGELARLGGKLTAPAEKMGGDWFTKVTTANALLQTSKRTGFGTVDAAAEGLKGFMDDSFKVGKQFSAKSFAQVNGVDTLLDPVKLIGDIFRKTGGNALQSKGFSEPAAKFLESYRGTYSQAFAEAKTGGKSDTEAREAGAKAVEDFINAMKTNTSTLEAEEAKRNAVMDTAGERMANAWENIKQKLTASALPLAEKFVTAFEGKSEEIAKAGEVLIGILGVIGEAFQVLADGVLGWAEVFDRLTGNRTEGDTLKTVTDEQVKHGATLPVVGGIGIGGAVIGAEKGAWVHEKGAYKFIKAPEGADITKWMADAGMEVMGTADPSNRIGGQGVFQPKKITKEQIAAANTSFAQPEERATMMAPYLPVDTSVATPANEGLGPTVEAAKSAAEAHQDLSTKVDEAADAVGRLTSKIDDLSSSMNSLNRNGSFLDQGS